MSRNSDNYPDCFSFAAPGANLLRRFSSSFATDEKSPLFAKRAFRIWSAREDYASLREAPCGPLLTQRCLAALGSNLLRRFSSSFTTDEKKPAFCKAGFLNDGRRERIRTSDPLVPNQLRYQAALLADFVLPVTAYLFCLVRREGLEPSRP